MVFQRQGIYARREPRFPLNVQVTSKPLLHDAWAVDLGVSGVGLIASGTRNVPPPHHGDVFDLEFLLPGVERTVRPRGRVQWLHRADGRHEPIALGLQFVDVGPADAKAIRRYVAEYRFEVALFADGSAEQLLAREALDGHAHLHSVEDEQELQALLTRTGISVVLACTADGTRLGAIAEAGGRNALHDPAPGSLDWVPPLVVHLGEVPPSHLVALFNRGCLFHSLGPSTDVPTLQGVVLKAVSHHALRSDHHRVAAALSRVRKVGGPRAPKASTSAPRRAEQVVRRGPEMERVLDLIEVVAPHKVDVLLQGETGTGKEVLASVLHEVSDRAEHPFVIQDCGVLTETLLESELFGHVKGAFTGAVSDHPGIFVIADGGTVFLDEVENTTPKLQAQLLRVIESGTIRPVGSARTRIVDVRIVAASNRDLLREVEEGRFRSDLYYRLSSFVVDLPPLRARPDDISPLALHFLQEANRRFSRAVDSFSERAMGHLRSYDWPGNVRELRNVIERAVLLSAGAETLEEEALPEVIRRDSEPHPGNGALCLKDHLASVERELITGALERHGWVLRRAAKELGVSPVTLGRKAQRFGLRVGSYPRDSLH